MASDDLAGPGSGLAVGPYVVDHIPDA